MSHPITNLPDLLNLHHGNPLGIAPLWQLIAIFALILIMEYFLFHIRRRQKAQYYPVLFTMYGIITVCLYYYCFQDGLPTGYDTAHNGAYDQLGWFCSPSGVGLGWAIVGLACATAGIAIMLNATQQIMAQMAMYANPELLKSKPWKEWKMGDGFAVFSIILVCLGLIIGEPVATTWLYIAGMSLLIIFVLVKMIADVRREKNLLWGVGTGLVFLAGVLPIITITLGCAEAFVAFIIVIIVVFTSSKARKRGKKTTVKS